MRAGVVFFLFLAAAIFASAQPPGATATPAARPRKILFVGNSFTHGKYLPVRTYNSAAVIDENVHLPATDPRAHHAVDEEGSFGGIPGIFKKLTDEAGLNYEVHVEAVSAKTLAFHYEHALSVIAQPGWDVVVLQGYSTEPLPAERGGEPENFLAAGLRLEEAIHAANPHAKVFVEETWPRADLVYPPDSPYHGTSVVQMATDLRTACSKLRATGKFWGVVHVGDTWTAAIAQGVAVENPYQPAQPGKLDLWGPDHYHPSVYGAYLGALVLCRDVALENASTWRPDEQAAHDLGISPADAVRLQEFGTLPLTYEADTRRR